jgi:N-acetylated-alpha-linked acidic dipeptidase
MRTLLCATLTAIAALALAPSQAAAPAGAHPPESELEHSFRDGISAERIGGFLKDLTEHPNFPGSAYAKRDAEYVLEHFRSFGWDAKIETFSVLFPRPIVRSVELLGPKPFTAKLHEPAIPGDATSAQQDEQLESYFIYSPDGEVTAPIIYVNFGLREDYAELERQGISVKGAIVLIRYGRLWRGGKVELAAEHGAIGALIYSDPREDGYFQGPTYPEGSWRHPDAVQRGSVLYGLYPGDPLTPFVGATAPAKRLPIKEAITIAAIPCLPLSYADAEPLFRALAGPTAPEGWRGALPLTYRIGPSTAPVHLRVAFRWDSTVLYDVIARLKGDTYPDEWVIRGNHRDGWVYGAQDPHSAHSAMLEEARNLGQLYRAGWRPKRTIVYASWDAEEEGTLGSTEWMEAHFDELARKGVLYLNSDVTMTGLVQMSGSPSLEAFARDASASVTDPATGLTTLARAELAAVVLGSRATPTSPIAPSADHGVRVSIDPPGYGSDHHAFVARSGVPTLNLSFFDDSFGGSYHSIYDDYAWYTRFNDPGFLYGRATAQLIGTAILGFADADLLPLEFTGTAHEIERELGGLKHLYAAYRGRQQRDETLLDSGAYRALAPDRVPKIPPRGAPAAELDFRSLEAAVARIGVSAAHFSNALAGTRLTGATRAATRRANAALLATERAFLRQGGLPGRPYYQNELYSPGRLWDTVPFPAIGDAILDGDLARAAAEVPRAAHTLDAIAAAIDAAADAVRAPIPPIPR